MMEGAAALTTRSTARHIAGARLLPWVLALLVLVAAVPAILAVPPLDRDESRFAQATKQMLESGDYVVINFQDNPRNKKPAGIHWLQAASVAVFSSAEAAEIWAYRLPSLAGALAAVLVLLRMGRRLFGEEAGGLAAFLLACCLGLQLEALMAKTDAVLLLTILAAQLALWEIWHRSKLSGPESWAGVGWRVLFWAVLGAGVLIKGPIAPLVVGLTILALCTFERRWRWLGRLSPLWGLLLFLALAAPWFLVVTFLRDSSFIGEAASRDLFAKVLGGEETHGAPPGYYLAAHLLYFFPGALFALPALIAAWRQRLEPAVLFCLAWLLPTWIFFELVPTKLPHYVMPTYPALALLTAWAVTIEAPQLRRRWVCWLQALFGLGGLAAAAAWVLLPIQLESGFLWQSVPSVLILLVGVGGPLALAWRGRWRRALLWGGVGSALYFAWSAGALLPQVEKAFSSPLLVEEWRRLQPAGEPPLASSSFHEPSLVFLAGTETLLTRPEELVRYLRDDPAAIVLVSNRAMGCFLRASLRLGELPFPLSRLRVFNYSKGYWEEITFFAGAAR
jgi:4-amino-4-deoxy-L-arabinose transferase-like glycosyltransferase